MSDQFLSYEREFLTQIASFKSSLHRNDHKSLVNSQKSLQSAERALKMMQKQVHTLPASIQHQHYTNLKGHRATFQDIQKILDQKQQSTKAPRSQNETQMLLAAQRQSLDESRALAFTTEEMSIGAMNALKGQGDQFRHAKQGTDQIKSNLERTNKFINAIQRRAMTNKLIMLSINVLLVLCILAAIYIKFIKKS